MGFFAKGFFLDTLMKPVLTITTFVLTIREITLFRSFAPKKTLQKIPNNVLIIFKSTFRKVKNICILAYNEKYS